jgi:ArsR family transcriptional regulator
LPDKQYAAEADFMKALSHPTRLQIVELLRSGEKCVCEIYPVLNLEQANISRHLAVLKREGLLQSRKEGLKVIYWAPDHRIYQIIDTCSEMIRKMWLKKADLVK